MKKIILFCVTVVIFNFITLNAQYKESNKRIKEIANTIKYKNCYLKHVSNKQKVTELVKFLIENQDTKTSKKSYCYFSKCDSLKFNLLVNMPDTIRGRFLVNKIEKKLGNYKIVNNELEEVLIYLIYIQQVEDSLISSDQLVIISETLKSEINEELQVNVQYDLTMLPIFDKNCCLLKDGSIIVGHYFINSLIFNNICIFKLRVSSNYLRF